MQTFYAGEQQRLNGLLQGLSGVIEKYNRKDIDVLPALFQWLDGCIAQYKKGGHIEKESQFATLKAELVTAQRGVHPVTLEKITLRRHEFQMTIAWKVLQAAEARLRLDLMAVQDKLKEAAQLLGQVIVAGLQAGLLTKEKIIDAKAQEQIKALWTMLATDANIAIGQTRALLMVSEFDIIILLGDLFASIK